MPDDLYLVGIDVGTSYVKSVILNKSKEIVGSFIKRTGATIEHSSKIAFEKAISIASLSRSEIQHITSTGFGKNKISFANITKTEIS